MSTLPQLALPNQQLLAQSQHLAFTIVAEQAGEQGSKRGERYEKRVQDHVGRMTGLGGEANTAAGN